MSFPRTHARSVLAIIAPVILFSILLSTQTLRWETNDDIAMSMIAHGYGLADHASPQLVFSSVVWGWLVQHTPSLDGVLGYSVAMLCMLLISSVTLLWAMIHAPGNTVPAILLLTLIYWRPILFPQFTLVAGLLAVGAAICWIRAGTSPHLRDAATSRLLWAGSVCALFAFLIRSQILILILLIALPLMPCKRLFTRSEVRQPLLFLAIGIVLILGADHVVYQGADWQEFKAFDDVRVPFTDYQLASQLKRLPERLSTMGYSANDLDLLANWFSIDPNIADPSALRPLVAGRLQHLLSDLPSALNNGWQSIRSFWSSELRPLLLAAIALLALRPRRTLLLSWFICLTVFFLIGALGRPGISRIYHPVVSLLAIVPLVSIDTAGRTTPHPIRSRVRRGITIILLAACTIVSAWSTVAASRAYWRHDQDIRNDLKHLDTEHLLVWGGSFPYESLYPVLKQPQDLRRYRLYALGSFTLAPFSVSFVEERQQRGANHLLRSPGGLRVLATTARIELLRIYCAERHQGTLQRLEERQYGSISILRLRCMTAPGIRQDDHR